MDKFENISKIICDNSAFELLPGNCQNLKFLSPKASVHVSLLSESQLHPSRFSFSVASLHFHLCAFFFLPQIFISLSHTSILFFSASRAPNSSFTASCFHSENSFLSFKTSHLAIPPLSSYSTGVTLHPPVQISPLQRERSPEFSERHPRSKPVPFQPSLWSQTRPCAYAKQIHQALLECASHFPAPVPGILSPAHLPWPFPHTPGVLSLL